MRLLLALAQDGDLSVQQTVLEDLECQNEKGGKKVREKIGITSVDSVANQNELFVELSKETLPEIVVLNKFLPGERSPEEVFETVQQLAPATQIVLIAGELDKESKEYISAAWRLGIKIVVSWEGQDVNPGSFVEMVLDGIKKAMDNSKIQKSKSVEKETKDDTPSDQGNEKKKNLPPNNVPPVSDIPNILITVHEAKKKDGLLKSAINKINRTRERISGKPAVVLGLGNTDYENWFMNVFNETGILDVIHAGADSEGIREALSSSPDIFIVGRQWAMGGVQEADKLAVEAAEAGSSVIFIAGELDDEGKEMVGRVKAAGVEHIISCQPESGSYISGEELVFMVRSIIRDIETREHPPRQIVEKKQELKKDTIKALKNGTSLIGQILKQDKPKKAKSRFIDTDGLSLEDEKVPAIISDNLKTPTTIKKGGLFAVVSPWRPGLAGRLAAQAVKMFNEVEGSEVVFISASKDSTGALWLDIADDELMMSDWRIPGSHSPIKRDRMSLYAVDPSKNLHSNADAELWEIVKTVRKTSTYTVLDCAGDMDKAQKSAFLGWSVLLVILPGSDPVELKISQLWLRNIRDNKPNVVVGIDLRNTVPMVPDGIKPKIVIRNNPADALSMALKRDANDEFRLD